MAKNTSVAKVTLKLLPVLMKGLTLDFLFISTPVYNTF